jgi:hypothetical protein
VAARLLLWPVTATTKPPALTPAAAPRAALGVQGLKNAVPKSILAMMDVDGMSRENVASHLQARSLTACAHNMRRRVVVRLGCAAACDAAVPLQLFASSAVVMLPGVLAWCRSTACTCDGWGDSAARTVAMLMPCSACMRCAACVLFCVSVCMCVCGGERRM